MHNDVRTCDAGHGVHRGFFWLFDGVLGADVFFEAALSSLKRRYA
jgi:hypothetical protein